MFGICGTCARRVEATQDNQGYSSCCNDRIEYGLEASETLMHARAEHTVELLRLQKKIRSLQSGISVAYRKMDVFKAEAMTKECEGLKNELKWVKNDIKAINANIDKGC